MVFCKMEYCKKQYGADPGKAVQSLHGISPAFFQCGVWSEGARVRSLSE